MIYQYFLMKPVYWIIPWILQSFAYFLVLKKMGLNRKTAIIPFLAEKEFSKLLFRRIRSFWRPFIITAVFVIGAYYLGPDEGTGHLYMIIAFVIYGFFLIRLYHRMAKSFGRGIPYTILMVLLPPLFVGLLGAGNREFTPPVFREEKDLGRFGNWVRRGIVVLISAAEIIALVLVVGFFTIRQYPPRLVVNGILNDTYSKTKDIVSDDSALTREDTMGEAFADIGNYTPSRDKFFADHSGDKSVVVMEYIIGSNLENSMGMATANINMMKDATKRGDALTFVLEAGGSGRWFTDGIEDGSGGRYAINDGKLEKAEDLTDAGTMEDPARLEEFIKWTAEKYPADRYMLVLWDHGGGVGMGYGEDDLLHRTDEGSFHGIRVSEIVKAIAGSGVRFDVIGFDACLMQDVEIANALEPYADYYLASEETEGGLGWYYTDAFGRLAENPGLDSEEFGKTIISTYDQFNRITNDDEPKTDMTLSFVDLTLLKPAYEKLEKLYVQADEAIRNDPSDFADIGLAAMNSYSFASDTQTDLIDFMDKLDDADVNDSICAKGEKDDLINALRASVLYRNRDSAKGVNGLAFSLAYKGINYYDDTSAELKRMGLKNERKLFNDVFSIIAAQKKKEHEELAAQDDRSFSQFIRMIAYIDHTESDWYEKGFEDYSPDTDLIDIPLIESGKGFVAELPEKTWDIIADCQTMVYQKTEDGRLRYLGSEHTGGKDENGHPLIYADDDWVNISGRPVCYESTGERETDEGMVYTGDVRARLNGVEEILIHIEWDPAPDADSAQTGRVTGYDSVDDTFAFMEKGSDKFESGDKIEFLFDYYDEEGNLVSTESYGRSIRVTTQDNLKVSDMPLEDCDIEFLGILTDVYQRSIMTEVMEAHIGE